MTNGTITRKTRSGKLSLTKWNNGKDKYDNDKISFTLQKSWKKEGSDEWQRADVTLFPTELAQLKTLLAEADAELIKEESIKK